jgi:HPt (histidine-containing phosphotransfer) domain-containing protein
MMPQMCGIEATQNIRSMGYTRPVVALTANAVSGQADIFLGNGFDDFISKPIDVRQLNTVLNRFIRDKQTPEVIENAKRQAEEQSRQPADNTAKPDIDPRFAEIFVRDAAKSLAALDAIMEKQGEYSEDELRTYVIHVHGMKSALANMGKMDLSAVALKLEAAGREGKLDIVISETPAFLSSLRDYAEELKPKDEGSSGEISDENKTLLREKLIEIKAACEDYDEDTADKALVELRNTSWPQPVKDLLGTVEEQLLHSDFDEIVDNIEKFMETGQI